MKKLKWYNFRFKNLLDTFIFLIAYIGLVNLLRLNKIVAAIVLFLLAIYQFVAQYCYNNRNKK